MKKFLSLLLAAAMTASMSAVSFAASWGSGTTLSQSGLVLDDGTPDKLTPAEAYESMIKTSSSGTYYDDDDGFPVDTTIIGPFGYNNDDKYLSVGAVEYGKTAYFLLTEFYLDSGTEGAGKTRLVTNSDTTKNLKVKGDWEEGKSLVDSLAITKKKVNGFAVYSDLDEKDNATLLSTFERGMEDEYGFESGKYYYLISLTIEDSTSVSDADIIGTLTLSKSKKPKADDIDFDVAINVDWEQSYRQTKELTITGDYDPIYAETYYALKFDCDEEIELGFSDDSTFTVDVSGQSKTLIYFDTDFNSSIAAKYPLAELNFWNGNGAKFNRTGELFLSIGDDDYDDYYLYQVNSDGTLSEVPGAEYDSSDEGFYFRTRTLGSYVVSDMELDTSATDSTDDSDESDDVVVTPVEPSVPVNPGTGARA